MACEHDGGRGACRSRARTLERAHAVGNGTSDPGPPWIESPYFEELLAEKRLAPADAERARTFQEVGFLVLPDFFPAETVDAVRAAIDTLHAEAVEDRGHSANRFQDAWRNHDPVAAMAAEPRLLELLATLYGRRPIPFQTLNFRRGSEQRPHADTIHFSSLPRGYMCGVWVALEDVGPANGTLVYYPGSHRLSDLDLDALSLRVINYNRPGPLNAVTYQDYERCEDFTERRMAAAGLAPTALEAPRGTAFVWAAGLVHGGGPVLDPASTRWSQVTHYYFADCVYYAPILSNLPTGDLYLKRVVDIATGEVVRQRYRGLPLPDFPTDGTYKLVLDLDDAGADHVRLVSNYEIKHLADDNAYLRSVKEENANLGQAVRDLEAAIAAIERSPSHRLGRLLTALARALRPPT